MPFTYPESSNPPLSHHDIAITHGTLHISSHPPNESSNSKLTLLHIHGNSSCSQSFHRLLSHTITQSPPSSIVAHRSLLLDLPGHGASTDAPDPETSYTQAGYAAAALEALHAMGVLPPTNERGGVVVMGWSLGGHVALEMVAADEARMAREKAADATASPKRWVKGIMIVGTPPALGEEQVAAGFIHEVPKDEEGASQEKEKKADEEDEDEDHMLLAELETWPAEAFDTFPFEAIGRPHEAWIRDAAKRTDGRARRIMFAAFKEARGVDQRKLCEESDVPIAVVNGGAEPFVNLDYLDGIAYKNLWEGKAYRMEGLGHAPFWERPDLFAPFWERFVGFCEGI